MNMKKTRVDLEKLYYGFPVVLISFYDENGVPNVTTVSSTYTLKDMMVVGLRSKGYAVQQIKQVKDFVVNIPNAALEQAIGICGSHTGREHNKFELAQLTPVQSPVVHAPVIRECPIAIECSLTEVIERDIFAGITNLLAQIKGRCAAGDYLASTGGLHLSKIHPVSYFGDGKAKSFKFTE